MSAPFVAFDLTRIFFGPLQMTPRGIDRIEVGFAEHFLREWSGDSVATLPSPLGARAIGREQAIAILETVQQAWGERDAADQHGMIARLKDRLTDGQARHDAIVRRDGAFLKIARIVRSAGRFFGPSAAAVVPRNGVYVNTGQVGLANSRMLSWLGGRPDIKPVFMLHDVIPIDHPEYVSPIHGHFHRNMVAATAAHAAGLIVTTKVAGAAICRELQRIGRFDIPLIYEPLPVAPIFTQPPERDDVLSAAPYFVVVGSIEPRKNHAVLLQAWQDEVRADPAGAPKLVIVGARGRRHEAITGAIAASPALRSHVIEMGGLSTPSLHRVLSNARALLMPSMAEGFGLPIIEALALGLPVLASNIAAHREVGGGDVTYLDPSDPSAWRAAIRARMLPAARAVAAPPGLNTWPGYLRRLESFLSTVAMTPRVDSREGTVPLAPSATAIAYSYESES